MHGTCTGAKAHDSGLYTPEYAKRVAKCVLMELDQTGIFQESQGKSQLPEFFGTGSACYCKDLRIPNLPEQKCIHCWDRGGILEASGCEGELLEASGRTGDTQAQPKEVNSAPRERPPGEAGCHLETMGVEELATRYMSQNKYDYKSCEHLLEQMSLRSPNKVRSLLQDQQAEYLSLGVYSHGGFYGETLASQKFPQMTKYLNLFGRKHLPKQMDLNHNQS